MQEIMQTATACVLFTASALPCFAKSTSLDVPRLGLSPDTESVTNVAFDAGREDARLLRLTVETNASESNGVEVAFGRDRDGNGSLDRHEADVAVGWDSGEWLFLDRRSRAEARKSRPAGARRLDWRLSLDDDRKATALTATDSGAVVFSGAVPSTMFDPDWNMMRITARGLSEPEGSVSCKVTAMGIMVIMR